MSEAYGRSLTYCSSCPPSPAAPFRPRTRAIGSTSSNRANSAARSIRLRIEHVRFAEGQVLRVYASRIFVEQVPEIGCRAVGRGDGQQHFRASVRDDATMRTFTKGMLTGFSIRDTLHCKVK